MDKEDYLKIINPEVPKGTRWQLEYARMFDRITDNSKVLRYTGMKQENLKPLYDALKLTIEALPEGFEFAESDVSRRMDAYLEEKGL